MLRIYVFPFVLAPAVAGVVATYWYSQSWAWTIVAVFGAYVFINSYFRLATIWSLSLASKEIIKVLRENYRINSRSAEPGFVDVKDSLFDGTYQTRITYLEEGIYLDAYYTRLACLLIPWADLDVVEYDDVQITVVLKKCPGFRLALQQPKNEQRRDYLVKILKEQSG